MTEENNNLEPITCYEISADACDELVQIIGDINSSDNPPITSLSPQRRGRGTEMEEDNLQSRAIAPETWAKIRVIVREFSARMISSVPDLPAQFRTQESGTWDANPPGVNEIANQMNINDGILNFPANLSNHMEESRRLIENAERETTSRAAQELGFASAIAQRNFQKQALCEKCKFHNENRYITCAVNPLFMQDTEEEFCRDYEEEIIIEEVEQQDSESSNNQSDVTDLNPDYIGGVSFSTAAESLIRALTVGRFS